MMRRIKKTIKILTKMNKNMKNNKKEKISRKEIIKEN